MDKLTFIILIIFLYIAGYGIAKGESTPVFYRTSDLIYLTETGDEYTKHEINGYLQGVSDAYSNISWCNTGIKDYGELNRIISDYVYSNPKLWNYPARDVIQLALQEAYPCKK